MVTIVAGAAVLLLAYAFRPVMPLPRVSRIVQLTKSGGSWPREPMYTDGPRVYYQSLDEKAGEADTSIRQLLLNGNEDTLVGIPGRFLVRGLSPDDTEFLAIALIEGQSTVWRIPVASSGSPRRGGNLVAEDIAWSHDSNWLAYAQGTHLFLANSDGSSSRPLASVPAVSAQIDNVRLSPDDRHLRFTLIGAGLAGTLTSPTTTQLWEVGADGRGLHEMRFPWPATAMECCGDCTLDARYFVFQSHREALFTML